MPLGADNMAVVTGPHANAFQNRIGKTHFAGRAMKPGEIWQGGSTSFYRVSSVKHLLTMRQR